MSELLEQPEAESNNNLFSPTPSEETDSEQEAATETEGDEPTETVDDDGSEEGEPTETSETDEESHEVIEVDGEEISLDQVREWKEAGMRQSDYTRKTQELAKERKSIETDRGQLDTALQNLNDIANDIQTMVTADLDNVDMEELRETDTAEYLKLKEQKEQRQKQIGELLEKAEQVRKQTEQQEAQQLHKALSWDDKAKRSEDVKAINSYIKDLGLTEDEFAKVNNHKVMIGLLEGAKYRALKNGDPAKNKKAVKKPKVANTKKSQTQEPKSLADRLWN